ncbi:MAG: hypothetical protein ACI8QC_002097 [Planctomycetota bacterium]|jgi:hypothetical protein
MRYSMQSHSRRGMTMVELVLAAFLSILVMTGVFSLLDTSLDLWTKGEKRRAQVERSGAILELLTRDLRGMSGGERGDLLVDWQPFDVDGDKAEDRVWPRLRFVRQASEAELARLYLEGLSPEVAEQLREEGFLPAEGGAGLQLDPPPATGLVEVCWAVVPAGKGDAAMEGLLMRGVRKVGGGLGSFLEPGFFARNGMPPVDALTEVTGGVLWFQPMMATRDSLIREGWELGSRSQDVASAWDARGLGRPDKLLHPYNEVARGQTRPTGGSLLPRSVLIQLEFESERERERRPRLLSPIDRSIQRFEVTRGELLPRSKGNHVLIGGEWMVLVAVEGDFIKVQRGARATLPAAHADGEMVHFGQRVVTEVPIPMYTEDWNQ